MKISGTFEVNLKPLDPYATGQAGNNLGRMSIDKKFSGGLTATSQGEMLMAMTGTKGSAGYVAIEKVVGKLCDKQGSFVLQHFGIMNRGKDRLLLELVPDSGTEQLSGLSGKMVIKVDDGQHSYEFDFDLPEAQ